MPHLQHFFAHGEYLGAVNRENIWVRTDFAPPPGEAFFCPLCNEVWFLAPVVGQATKVHHLACTSHKAGSRLGWWSLGVVPDIPGSVWDFFEGVELPKKLLEREFHLHMKYYEGEIEWQNQNQ